MNSGEQIAVEEQMIANGPVRTAVIGDFRRDDFRVVVRRIREITAAAYFDDLPLFFQTAESGPEYDLIFLLASAFGQYFPREIARLQARHPMARFVMIAGSLAEGERRTGFTSLDVFRYYWHQWETEALPNFKAFCRRRNSAWSLPGCSSEEERLLKTAAFFGTQTYVAQQVVSNRQTALVLADDPAMREMLTDSISQAGFDAETLCLAQLAKYEAKITDLSPARILLDVVSEHFPETLATVRFLRTYCPPSARLTVLYNAPRPDETRQLVQAGVRRVISKPFF